MDLDIEKTYRAIVEAARGRRYISYGDLASASGVPWAKARRIVPQQLGKLMEISHQRGWPYLSAIVVPKEHIESGLLEGKSLEGFIGAARGLGERIEDSKAFVAEHRQRLFDWAPAAPDRLEPETEEPVVGEVSGPRFLRYFGPVLDALRDAGGKARPQDVFEWVKAHVDVPASELDATNKGGQSKFENKVAWARFYLVKAGLVDGGRRGVWALTAKGREAHLDHAAALRTVRDVRARFKMSDSVDDDNEAPDDVASPRELFDDPARRFWFVGATWAGKGDQTERFLQEGIWQNGYDDKFSDLVQRMKPGDKIAIKASFVQKYNLPFDNRGKPVSCMRIKAIGTISENLGDRATVKVDWQLLDPPRDWYFYTYRVTAVEADPNEDLARRLILFAFADARQDYVFWTTEVPYFAKKYGAAAKIDRTDDVFEDEGAEPEAETVVASYTTESIVAEGGFLPKADLDLALTRIQSKKNLILQGPPGTGKTWLARKLAYALIGSSDRKVTRGRLRSVQFHPSLSYEDFVRGWRPTGQGGFKLLDGIFLEMAQAAAVEPDQPFVLIVEEINRGNPAQIFGDVLTILEDSKRTADEAIELSYPQHEAERIFIPKNLYVIGTMNIADRSLALVDLALRRRFAFLNLEPQFNSLWREWCIDRGGLLPEDVETIASRMIALNDHISEDRSLGSQYRIGHSYVTPSDGAVIADGRRWFRDIVDTEIVPLLEEYWFDAPDKVKAANASLREGL